MGTSVRVREFRRTGEVLDDLPVARTSIAVKLAVLPDLEQVVALCLEARNELGIPYSGADSIHVASRIERLMDDPATVVVSGWIESQIAGIAVVRMPVPNPFQLSCELQLDSLYVASHWRRRGVGQALLAKVVVIAEENEVETIASTSPAPDRMALRFMARRGFSAQEPNRAVTLVTLRRMLGKSMELDRRGLTREEIIARRRRSGKDSSGNRAELERDWSSHRGSEMNAQARRADATRRPA